MEQQQSSSTALVAAFFRAHHYAYDAPRIFEDPVAARLLTPDDQERFDTYFSEALTRRNPPLAAACPDRRATVQRALWESAAAAETLSRARYAEDKLAAAVQTGIGQYVLVSAGLDTFAFRRPEGLAHLQVFEVDHPAVQAFKRQRLAEVGLPALPTLHFVAADLTQESLAAALVQSPFRPDTPTFFSWLGVTMYLPQDAVFATFRALRSMAAPGSQVVFDYMEPAAFDPGKVADRVRVVMEGARQLGEPFRSGFDPLMLEQELATIGFQVRENLSPDEIGRYYFQERGDTYRACEHAYFAWAVVAEG